MPKPLVIPRALQAALPYRDKPKERRADHKPGSVEAIKAQRPAVVLEPHEQKVAKLMSMLKARYEDRQERLHNEAVERLAKHREEVAAEAIRKVRFALHLFRKLSYLIVVNSDR